METCKLTDRREESRWIRARLDDNRIHLEAEPGKWSFTFETEAQVKQFILHLESSKGQTYARPGMLTFFRGKRMKVEGRYRGVSVVWDWDAAYQDCGNRIYANSDDVDEFVHQLMHLAWMAPRSSE